jgi:hypothetical protein
MAMNFGAIRKAVNAARMHAHDEAKKQGRFMKMPFVRSRGTFLCTLGPGGQEWPNIAAECPVWDGTKKEIVELVERVLAEAPRITEIYIEGAFDASDRMIFDDYEPRITEWSVTIWTRDGGYAVSHVENFDGLERLKVDGAGNILASSRA